MPLLITRLQLSTDSNKPVTVTGSVTMFEWMNPHSGIHIDGRDAQGNAGEWVIELGGSQELTRSGWTKASLKAGDKITVEGWMARDGSKHVNAKQVKMSNGKTLMAASSYNAPNGDRAATSAQQPAGTSGQLPSTASPLLLVGAIGVLSTLGGLGLRALRK